MKLLDPAPWVLAFLGVTALIWSLIAPWNTKTRQPRVSDLSRGEGLAAKVGKSADPERRLATHAMMARVHGGGVRQCWTSARHDDMGASERKLLEFCRHAGEQVDREYFRGTDFSEICHLGERLAADARRRAYLNELVAAADGDLSVTWREAHERLDDGTDVGESR